MTAAIGHQTDVAETLDELYALGRQHNITGQRQIEAGTSSHAVYHGDDRFGAIIQSLGGRTAAGHKISRLLFIRQRLQGCQISAGAKSTALAAEHQHTHLVIGRELPDGRRQLLDQPGSQAVQRLRSVKIQPTHTVFLLS